jgi:hypothetical protein
LNDWIVPAVVDDDNRVRRRLKNRCKTQAVFEQLLFELSNRHEFLKVLQGRGKRLKRVADETMLSAYVVKRLRRCTLIET